MTMHDDTDEMELTPRERAAFAALPREADPGRLLEERTVRALRERGTLRDPRRRIAFPAGWMAAAAAAAIALFVGGVATGQWMSARSTAQVVAEVQAGNARQATLLVQQTGTAYVTALGQLAQMGDTTVQGRQAREVAVQVLRAAADELVRIAPDDPVASGILAGYDRARQQQARPDSAGGKRRVVWF